MRRGYGAALAPRDGMAGDDDGAIVIVDADPAWDRLLLAAHRIVRVVPRDASDLGAATCDAVLVNLASPGALEAVERWPRHGARAIGCVTVAGSEQVALLRGVAVVPGLRPAEPIAVHLRGRRRVRAVAASGNARALLALRRVLGAQGVGVSLAWDALQARDLCELVHPTVMVVDLALPRDAHELVVALALRRHVPDLVVVPGLGDPAGFARAFERMARRVQLPSRREALVALLAGVGDGSSAARSAAAGAPWA